MGRNTDDFRTNSLTFGVQHQGWVVALDDAMLTNRNQPGGMRCDQITVSFGHEWQMSATRHDRLWLAAGIGGRVTDDVGGDQLQNHWHELNSFKKYSLPEDSSACEGQAWAHGEWLLTGAEAGIPDLPFLRPGQLGLDLRASGMVTTGGETLGNVGLNLVVLGVDGHAMVGVCQELRGGTPPNATAARVAERERGTCFTYGVGAGGWFFQGGWELGGPNTWGALGWQWGRESARRPVMVADLEGGFAVYQGYAFGFQYRWQPDWLAQATANQVSLFADYRFGRYPGPTWKSSNTVVLRQGLLGLDWAPWRFGGESWSVSPFAQGGAGIREERIRADGRNPAFPDQESQRLVLDGTLGLRFLFTLPGNAAFRPAYGFSVVYDAWKPIGEAQAVAKNGTTATYQEAGGALGVRFNARVAW